ncbi:MAG: hypothetical protein ACREPJ_06955 [Rhodanobacteraceae bacterium]
MKTTIDIADDLIKRARRIQARDDVTLRSLVEDGLREIIAQRTHRQKQSFVPVFAGPKSVDPTLTPAALNRLISESNERPPLRRALDERADSCHKRESTGRKHDRG